MIIPAGMTVYVGKRKYKSGDNIDSSIIPTDTKKRIESKTKQKSESTLIKKESKEK
jgi:hypothetical protein